MNEQKVKDIILAKYGSIKSFSEHIKIPNSTIVSILDRGFLNAKLKNVFAICKALNINPLDLDTGFHFVRSTNIVQGDNLGVNGLYAGKDNTNTYNFGFDSNKQGEHNDSMKALGVADVKMSRALLNAQTETNNKLIEIIELLETQNQILSKPK